MIKKVKKGFTLIELVVVIAVIAILSAVSVVAYVGITNSAKKSVAQQEATTLKTLLRAKLTEANYTSAGKATFSISEDKITCVELAANGFVDGLEDLIYVAQGSPTGGASEDSYVVSLAQPENGAPSEKFAVYMNNTKDKLFLEHNNGVAVEAFEIAYTAFSA